MLTALDHVKLRTPDLDLMINWYETHLGLKRGKRPEIPITGVWLYLNDVAVVHLMLDESPLPREATSLEQFAFRAAGMTAFAEKLTAAGVPFEKSDVAGTNITQFNLTDPMGNHLHVDFRDSDS